MFPLGEIQEYPTSSDERKAKHRTSKSETKIEENQEEIWDHHREAAEVHRQVRKYAREQLTPGLKLIDLCRKMENKARELVHADGLKAGLAFPISLSKNFIAAHFTPEEDSEMILDEEEEDILKIDFGVHKNGRIVDCAFTTSLTKENFERIFSMIYYSKISKDIYDPLMDIVREATNAGIKIRAAGIDVRLCEVGDAIHEVFEGAEIEIFQDKSRKTVPIIPVKNLGGHSIEKNTIHGGKSVPVIKNHPTKEIMEENEVYAIEVFGTTGDGYVRYAKPNSHFMADYDKMAVLLDDIPTLTDSAKELWSQVIPNFETFCFCRRHLDHAGVVYSEEALQNLVDSKLLTEHPPLVERPGTFNAHFEHTILLREECKEIVTRGNDY